MSVHYKFKSALEYDTVTFDGLHISVKDLKNAIVQQKRIGKFTDFDLQVTNAQTKEIYDDEHALIPKNTSLLIARIPLAVQSKAKTWEGYGNDSTPTPRSDEGGPAAKAVDLSSLDASEDDKIRAMMSQSTQDYDPSNYLKIRGANQVGAVPPNYRCYKCHQTGHWIKDCPLGQGTEQMEIKKSTGIPRSFMVPVAGPQIQGAMMTPYGSYAVPALDHQTYTQKQAPPPAPPPVQKTDIPEDLVCSICSDLLTDAVMIPCCGNSFCDECIRSSLLESEEHECPDCHEREISPGTLIPNRFLRNSVANFKNSTGYVKRQVYKPAIIQQQLQQQPTIIVEKEILKEEPAVETGAAKEDELKSEKEEPDLAAENTEKTIISEADSTEAPKTPILDPPKETTESKTPELDKSVDLPPGVSPSPEKTESAPITLNLNKRDRPTNATAPVRPKQNERSPRRVQKPRSPQPYQDPLMEERPGTPTVDEPGMGASVNNGSDTTYPSTNAPYPSGPPPVVIPTSIAPPHHMQVPPPGMNQPPTQYPPPVQQYPPTQPIIPHGPPPNFRLPPPGTTAPPNFMPGMYNVPPRPIFDPTRPPIQGPPPTYQGYSSRSRGRDYISRGMRGRTPPGIIDDPLEAFNRMLREKDERERRAKQRKGRSYSRSSSRSYSRSPRRRSRSPRRRSHSRSKSFSMSRSRSRSYSPANRASPYRDYSPRRRPSSRFRSSSQRSPSRYRYKDSERSRDRDYDRDRERDRDRDRDRDRERDRERDFSKRDRGYSRDRAVQDYHYYESYEKGGSQRSGKWVPPRDIYYAPEHQTPVYHQSNVPPVQHQAVSNRYMSRDQYNYKNDHIPSLMQQQVIPPRRYDDVAPPGTEQPLPPGEEPPRYEERYNYDNRQAETTRFSIERDNHDKYQHKTDEYEREVKRDERRYSRSPRKSKERVESPDKHKRKKREEEASKKEEKKKEQHSDDDKAKKIKDKKKKRDKKEADKKKKKEKREKHERKKEEKEKTKHEKKEGEEVVVPPKVEVPKEVERKEEKVLSPIREVAQEIEKKKSPSPEPESPKKSHEDDLYGDILSEGIDNTIVESYGKIDERSRSPVARNRSPDPVPAESDPPHETSKEYEDILELYTGELKSELDKEVLAPLPEKSKWEMDEDVNNSAQTEIYQDTKTEKSNKVTNEVLKRAENAIFAKAINAIRPIEIKKISLDRVKLYSGEKDDKKEEDTKMEDVVSGHQETVPEAETTLAEIEPPKPVRLSVKERLGCKVDDLDRIIRVEKTYDRNRSRTLSPLAKRSQEIKNERKVEIEDKRRDRNQESRDNKERHGRNYRNPERRDRDQNRDRNHDRDHKRIRERDHDRDRRERDRDKNRARERDERRERSRSRARKEEESKREKRKRSRTRSEDRRHKKRDRKHQKKEKPRKEKEEVKDVPKPEVKPVEVPKRKAIVDETSFVPDYDVESASDEEKKKKRTGSPDASKKKVKLEEKAESSSSDSSSSSSDDEKKKKKHKKHRKKKRKESSSSSSDSDSSSSDEEKERRKKKHKKKQKKKKKSKHK